MKKHHIIKGILLSAVSFLFFTCFDAMTKYLSKDYSVFQTMAVLFSASTVMMWLWVRYKHKHNSRDILKMVHPKDHLVHGLLQVVGQSLVFLALPHVTLAEFYVIIFMMPIIVVLMSAQMLKEKIARYIWVILLINFVGVLIAVRPDTNINPWMLVVFLGTFFLSGSLVMMSKMMRCESSEMTAFTGTIALSIGAIIPCVFVYQPFTLEAVAWMIFTAVLFTLAQLMIAKAYELAPTAYVGPPQFLQLVYGAIAGYLVFGDVPSMWVYIGGAIVVAANIWLLLKQHSETKQSSC